MPTSPTGGGLVRRIRKSRGSFLGRKFGSNKAKPFWGWHDRRTRKKKVLATGQWALDPAYAVSQNLKIPGRFSLDYVFNPYLDIGKPPAPSRSRILSKHLENIRLVEEIPRADESPGGETQAAGPSGTGRVSSCTPTTITRSATTAMTRDGSSSAAGSTGRLCFAYAVIVCLRKSLPDARWQSIAFSSPNPCPR